MSSPPAFRVFGFPVHVRSGFLMFMVLVVLINGADTGLWLAAFLAVLTLIHELGHAFAARATGARAEITLDLFHGYASFVPPRPLRWWERVGISAAGPVAQITVSCAALVGMGHNPLSLDDVSTTHASLALWWAGPVIGLYNLVPIVPFDGGHIVEALLGRVIGPRARTVMLYASVAITLAGVVVVATNRRLSPYTLLVAMPLLTQLQMLSARRQEASSEDLATAEARAWATGTVSGFGNGTQPSPWFLAAQQLRGGNPTQARDTLVNSLSGPTANWSPPVDAPPTLLGELVDLLPRPFPAGDLHAEMVLCTVLHRIGRLDEAARYGASCFGVSRAPQLALLVSRSAAALGEGGTALAWLRTALAGDPSGSIAETARFLPELAALSDPQVDALLGRGGTRPA